MGAARELWERTEKLLNNYDIEAAVEGMYAEDAAMSTSGSRYEGAKAIRKSIDDFVKAFPDGKVTTSNVVEGADSLVVEYTFEATHSGPLTLPDGSEIPPTGNSVRCPLVSVFDLRDGKVTEERMYLDNALLMGQLGLTG